MADSPIDFDETVSPEILKARAPDQEPWWLQAEELARHLRVNRKLYNLLTEVPLELRLHFPARRQTVADIYMIVFFDALCQPFEEVSLRIFEGALDVGVTMMLYDGTDGQHIETIRFDSLSHSGPRWRSEFTGDDGASLQTKLINTVKAWRAKK